MTYMKEHLMTCKAYLENSINADSCIDDEHNQTKHKAEMRASVLITRVKQQSRLEL